MSRVRGLHTVEAVDAAVRAIRRTVKAKPRVAIVLGTGMGGVGEKIRGRKAIPYAKVPGFARTTVESHKGELVFGEIEGKPVVAMEGRFHLYEGHAPAQSAFPVRVMRRLGAEALVVSAACGGMNPSYAAGDLAIVVDHINLSGLNPLAGPNDERLGPRFPDMSAPYDRRLIEAAEKTAAAAGIRAHRAVYVQVLGPNLETRAEYRFLRGIGADIVGMSLVPEVLAGVHCGFRVFGIAIITDMCLPDALKPAHLEEIIKTASEAEPKMTAVLEGLIRSV